MILTRVEKLKFIVEEMQLAFYLTRQISDPFVARTIARHILIRAENFVEHARALRRPLNNAGHDTRGFNRIKEAYASLFEEYFATSRDRIGAHVQDLDFGRRIELWNDIEIVKIGFFVDEAQEIYRSLAPLNLPQYVAYSDLPELTDSVLLQTLHQLQRAVQDRSRTEIGVDSLAMTRNNTSAVLNMAPVHVRAAQLALIRRWITLQIDLLERLAVYPRLAHILKARIITDIVSFCDCLVTRPVSPSAPQAMDGLDKLIAADGESPVSIDNFIAASNFHTELQTARAIRDAIGAHLEINNTHSITSLLANLDAYDFAQVLNFYERVNAAFTKTCRSIPLLRLFAVDGKRMYGARAGRESAIPYAGNRIDYPCVPPEPPAVNDEEAYRANLVHWLDGDDTQKGDARQFFWDAFANSQVLETIEEVESFGSDKVSPMIVQHVSRHEIRKAHQFLATTLSRELSDSDFRGILDLIVTCRGGWPYPLAEVLVRHGRGASAFRQLLICCALGEIGSAPHASVSEFLKERACSQSWPIRLEAALARFKTFVKVEGIFRINHRDQIRADYNVLVNSLLTSMSEWERILCLLAFASILSSPGAGSFSQSFRINYAALQSQLEALCLPFLKDDPEKIKATTLKQLIQTNDYVGVCVLLALDLDNRDQHSLHAALIDSCCNGSIVTTGHDQSSRHLAMCFLLKKERLAALRIASELAFRNPDWVDIQVLVAEILGDILGEEEAATQQIADLRHAYKLNANDEARLVAVETEMANRKRLS